MSGGSWIRDERDARGLSQANLARLLNVAQPKLSQWETERATPSPVMAEKVRSVFAEFDRHLADGTLPKGIRPRSRRRIERREPVAPKVFSADKPCPINAVLPKPDFTKLAQREHSRLSGIGLFAGCGGMSLGFRQAGVDVVGFVELEASARDIYQRNFPGTLCLGADVREISRDDVQQWAAHFGKVDVLFGGPPCQGFSLAGKRNTFDPRNQLFQSFANIAEVLKPAVVVLENVRLLTSMKAPDGRRVTEHIQRAFDSAGYRCAFAPLNAQDYGVPQSRERLFMIGVRTGGPAGQSPTFPLPTHGPATEATLFDPGRAPYATFRDAAGDLEALESGERSGSDPYHFAVDHPPHVIEWLKDVPEGESAHNNVDPKKRPPSGYNTTYKRLRWDEPSSTIGTTFGMISGCRTVHPTNTRSLTIREALRCQTFPDDFQLCGSLSDIRTAIGNAVPPLLARSIAQHVVSELLDQKRSAAPRKQARQLAYSDSL
ncbi:Modification methylase HaeIII [Caulifigura coniformis]|uniref:Cytosine-specific methyltransferase n=1 Tax=Caulifigura coniformis TaxID=2527983 RepID=A0A517SDT8_9PLAN|nr:DNA (cytosine-5-)-methyltransferase [Caulifigura coniformis]QDT54293.1 Modification methylase HaeIII [Caulifigura coniformis]